MIRSTSHNSTNNLNLTSIIKALSDFMNPHKSVAKQFNSTVSNKDTNRYKGYLALRINECDKCDKNEEGNIDYQKCKKCDKCILYADCEW